MEIQTLSEKLDEERFDKRPTEWKDVVKKYNPNGDVETETEMTDWLCDSPYTACDGCDMIIESISESRYEGYDFYYDDGVLSKEYEGECLCDDCFGENFKKGLIKKIDNLENNTDKAVSKEKGSEEAEKEEVTFRYVEVSDDMGVVLMAKTNMSDKEIKKAIYSDDGEEDNPDYDMKLEKYSEDNSFHYQRVYADQVIV